MDKLKVTHCIFCNEELDFNDPDTGICPAWLIYYHKECMVVALDFQDPEALLINENTLVI